MTGFLQNNHFYFFQKHVVLDMSDSYTCSFTEFSPFCIRLYYFSNFKDFSTVPQDWYLQILGFSANAFSRYYEL